MTLGGTYPVFAGVGLSEEGGRGFQTAEAPIWNIGQHNQKGMADLKEQAQETKILEQDVILGGRQTRKDCSDLSLTPTPVKPLREEGKEKSSYSTCTCQWILYRRMNKLHPIRRNSTDRKIESIGHTVHREPNHNHNHIIQS